MDQSRKKSFIVLMILSLFLSVAFVKDDPPLNKKDEKKLEKVRSLYHESLDLKQRADSLYSKIELIDASNSQDSRTLKRLENKALDLELKAEMLLEEAYLIENSVYDKSKPHLKLEILRNNERTLKLELLEDIIEELYSNEGGFKREINYDKQIAGSDLENQNELINIYIRDNNVDLLEQTSFYKTSDNGVILINEELLSVFLFNANSKDSIVSFNLFRDLFYSDTIQLTAMRSAWGKYLQDGVRHTDSIEFSSQKDTANKALLKDEQVEDKNTEPIKGIRFMVQIAADIVVLPSEKLNAIYKGNKKIISFREDEWFKYAVGNFTSYQEANKYREECGVGDAFVIAFNGNEKMDVLVAKRILRKINTDNINLTLSRSN
jgi:hypothetical protein